jgi:hypothetical protein
MSPIGTGSNGWRKRSVRLRCRACWWPSPAARESLRHAARGFARSLGASAPALAHRQGGDQFLPVFLRCRGDCPRVKPAFRPPQPRNGGQRWALRPVGTDDEASRATYSGKARLLDARQARPLNRRAQIVLGIVRCMLVPDEHRASAGSNARRFILPEETGACCV